MTLDDALRNATLRLQASSTPRIDAEVLLCHVLSVERTWLYTWGDRELGAEDHARFENLLQRRIHGEPVAYLIGHREFWGLSLETSSVTLIPRPDTERLVEAALGVATLRVAGDTAGKLLDLGTGTGAVALAFASMRPEWQVVGCDLSVDAAALATSNARRLELANASFLVSDWFSALASQRFDVIVSNPPYIDEQDIHLTQGDVRFEPRQALVSGERGMAALRLLIDQSPQHLLPGGWMWLEHGFEQGAAVREALQMKGYQCIETQRDLGGQERVSGGQRPR